MDLEGGGLLAPRVVTGEETSAWAVPLCNWDGGKPLHRSTVSLGHDGDRLFAWFRCNFDRLHVDPSLPRDRPAPGLWLHDVVELFVSDHSSGLPYREIEVSPLGQWLALSFDGIRSPSPAPWSIRPQVSANAGEAQFEIQVALPIAALRTGRGDGVWRIGLFRIQGEEPRREHYALGPTGTEQPDFHRPERFRRLVFGA